MYKILILFLFVSSIIYSQETNLINYPENPNIIILNAGDYKIGEFDIKLMDKEWWGIYENSNDSYIKKVKLKLDKIEPDIQYDWEYRISVDDQKNCLFLISGLALKEKVFDYYTYNDVLNDNDDFSFEFGPYHTYLSSKLYSEENIGEVIKRNYSIILNYKTIDEHIRQELFLFPCYYDKLYLRLVWAGDLDGDGNTDFLIQTPIPPNNEFGYATALYLSSSANSKELVKLVAYIISTGS